MPKRIPKLADRTKPRPREFRPSASVRGYDRTWRTIRDNQLAAHPFCADCLTEGRHAEATEVDHVRALNAGGTHDSGNLRSLCKSHHSRKTARVDGALGRAKQQEGES